MNLPTTIDPKAAKAVGPLPAEHPPVHVGKVGVLLVNLGTPDGTDYAPMRRYLKEFLSDPRVIEWPKAIWYPILYGIVLNTRPKKSGAAYAEIWNHERNESPLRTFTRSQGEKLAQALLEFETLTGEEIQKILNGETIVREDPLDPKDHTPPSSVPSSGAPSGGKKRDDGTGGMEPSPQGA